MNPARFDYQSVRHCSKTGAGRLDPVNSLITSQFDTAPKLEAVNDNGINGLITSQFDTAPKLTALCLLLMVRLITSQFDTAPKHLH